MVLAVSIALPLEDNGWLEPHHFTDAKQGRGQANASDGYSTQPQQLPGQLEREFRAPKERAEECRDADPETVAQAPDHQRLQQDHTQQCAVGRPHGLERSKVPEIVQGEVIERLSGNGGAHYEAEADSNAKIDGDAARGTP